MSKTTQIQESSFNLARGERECSAGLCYFVFCSNHDFIDLFNKNFISPLVEMKRPLVVVLSILQRERELCWNLASWVDIFVTCVRADIYNFRMRLETNFMSPSNVSSWTQGSVGQCVPRLSRVILNGLAHAFKYPAPPSHSWHGLRSQFLSRTIINISLKFSVAKR